MKLLNVPSANVMLQMIQLRSIVAMYYTENVIESEEMQQLFQKLSNDEQMLVKDLQRKLINIFEENKILNKDINEKKSELIDIKQELEILESESQQQKQTLEQYEQQIQEKDGKIEITKFYNGELQKDKAGMRKQIDEFNKIFNDIEKEVIRSVRGEIIIQAKEYSYSEKIRKIKQHAMRFITNQELNNRQIEGYKTQLNEKDREINNLKEQLQQAQDNYQALNNKLLPLLNQNQFYSREQPTQQQTFQQQGVNQELQNQNTQQNKDIEMEQETDQVITRSQQKMQNHKKRKYNQFTGPKFTNSDPFNNIDHNSNFRSNLNQQSNANQRPVTQNQGIPVNKIIKVMEQIIHRVFKLSGLLLKLMVGWDVVTRMMTTIDNTWAFYPKDSLNKTTKAC
eukprot:403371975